MTAVNHCKKTAKPLFTLKKRSVDSNRTSEAEQGKDEVGKREWQFLLVTPVKIHALKQICKRDSGKLKEANIVDTLSQETTKPSERYSTENLRHQRGQSTEHPLISIDSFELDSPDHDSNDDISPGMQIKQFSVDLNRLNPIQELQAKPKPSTMDKPVTRKNVNQHRLNMFRLRMRQTNSQSAQHMLVQQH